MSIDIAINKGNYLLNMLNIYYIHSLVIDFLTFYCKRLATFLFWTSKLTSAQNQSSTQEELKAPAKSQIFTVLY